MLIEKEKMTTKELIYYYALFGLMFATIWQGKDPIKRKLIEEDRHRVEKYLEKKGYNARYSIAHHTEELSKKD